MNNNNNNNNDNTLIRMICGLKGRGVTEAKPKKYFSWNSWTLSARTPS